MTENGMDTKMHGTAERNSYLSICREIDWQSSDVSYISKFQFRGIYR